LRGTRGGCARLTTFRLAHPQTVKSSQARWSMRWGLTTVLGSRPGDSFRWATSAASSAARRPRVRGVVRRAITWSVLGGCWGGLAYQRVVLGVFAVAPSRVVAVRPAGHFPAVYGEPTHMDGLRGRLLLRPGLDASLGEELGVQRVADGPIDLPHVS